MDEAGLDVQQIKAEHLISTMRISAAVSSTFCSGGGKVFPGIRVGVFREVCAVCTSRNIGVRFVCVLVCASSTQSFTKILNTNDFCFNAVRPRAANTSCLCLHFYSNADHFTSGWRNLSFGGRIQHIPFMSNIASVQRCVWNVEYLKLLWSSVSF